MNDEVKVILYLSNEVQLLLQRQRVNLYKEIQKELPSVKLEYETDPEAPVGSRGDITTVILAIASLVSAMSPIIIRLINQVTPPNRRKECKTEEIETHHPDGRVTIHRIRVSLVDEQHPQEQQSNQPKIAELPNPETKETKE